MCADGRNRTFDGSVEPGDAGGGGLTTGAGKKVCRGRVIIQFTDEARSVELGSGWQMRPAGRVSTTAQPYGVWDGSDDGGWATGDLRGSGCTAPLLPAPPGRRFCGSANVPHVYSVDDVPTDVLLPGRVLLRGGRAPHSPPMTPYPVSSCLPPLPVDFEAAPFRTQNGSGRESPSNDIIAAKRAAFLVYFGRAPGEGKKHLAVAAICERPVAPDEQNRVR